LKRTAKPATKFRRWKGAFPLWDGLIQPLVRGITGVAEETDPDPWMTFVPLLVMMLTPAPRKVSRVLTSREID